MSNTSTSKNPFEVRLEVLKMAQEMVNQSYNENTQLAWSMVEKVSEYQHKTMSEMQEYLNTLKPAMYTPEEVVKKANELYAFIIDTTKAKKD